jgi:hypothetical protein
MEPKRARNPKPPKKGRMHLRVQADIVERMHDYARRHHTDLTSIVTAYFLELLAAEEVLLVPEAEQI